MDASVILLSVPCSERVPPLTLRLMTRTQAALGGVVVRWHGSATKTKSSLGSMRRHSLPWTADGSARKGWQIAHAPRPVERCAVVVPEDG